MKKYIFLLIIPVMLFSSCGEKKNTPPPSSSEKKLIELLIKENEPSPVAKILDHTVWVYLHTDKAFIKIQAKGSGEEITKKKIVKQTIKYIDVKSVDKDFVVEYDIEPASEYEKSLGYGSVYTDAFLKMQHNALSALFETYSSDKNPPLFTVIVMADVGGIVVKNTVAFSDIKRYFSDQTFSEEYSKRSIIESYGDEKILKDTTGKSIEYSDLTWREFLAKQIKYRINFKYTRSAFSPSDNTAFELIKQAALSISSYDFDDYNSVKLEDISSHKENIYSKMQVSELIDVLNKNSEPGKLIEINFGN